MLLLSSQERFAEQQAHAQQAQREAIAGAMLEWGSLNGALSLAPRGAHRAGAGCCCYPSQHSLLGYPCRLSTLHSTLSTLKLTKGEVCAILLKHAAHCLSVTSNWQQFAKPSVFHVMRWRLLTKAVQHM